MKKIKEQIEELNLKLPERIKESISFGGFDKTLKKYNNIEQPKIGNKETTEIMPVFEKYYIQNEGVRKVLF
ncbi:hypothetical protein J4N46_00040 [Capnocytophaga sp. Marseille-Q4570]|uniref:Uncharacterized protein n=1 Tax=Capnocytophaga bilenii TaxID=2819369 RepID=A0ABS3PU53_9FLAO|nr:hypothetical protein [Capnocytophaga bilenii]MBO1882869.1 hypothetical protein [Capnocytophaga bilenii]